MGAKRRNKPVAVELNEMRVELDEWRAQRRPGKRIPEELWGAAVNAVGRHGLNPVSKALGLDYNCLKHRAGLSKDKKKSSRTADAVFVEMSPLRASVSEGCVVELEKGNGAKLRVSVQDAAMVDWARMTEAFLGA